MSKLEQPLGSVGSSPSPVAEPPMLRRIRAVVLLSGSVRVGQVATRVGRSLLEMPIQQGRTIIEEWADQAAGLAGALESDSLAVRVLVDHQSRMPAAPPTSASVRFSIERDPQQYRGTGGVLHDIARAYEDEDVLLVANGAQVLLRPLAELAAELAAPDADATIVAHEDGTPSGVVLLRCGVLRKISPAGFVDLKEQALPQICRDHRVSVVESATPTGMSMRTLSDYLQALRLHHMNLSNKPIVNDAWAENLKSSFAIVEEGAKVHPGVRIHDGVILAGSTVDPGAVVVRSLICPGVRIRRDQRVVDRVMAAASRESENRA
jgi:NDP-sugar pyrophosphorylase family protein